MATAILNGTVLDDGGLPCEARFQYGYTPALGINTLWRNGLRTGDTFREYIAGLRGGVLVYFRAQVRNAIGTTTGLTLSFITIPRDPIVVTSPATNISTTIATLNGLLVEDMGQGCEIRFEYGGTKSYGQETPWLSGFVTGDTFSQDIWGLSPGETCHCRAVARNRRGLGYGADVTFSTRSEEQARTGLSMELGLLLREDT